jgi:hypothetical protein
MILQNVGSHSSNNTASHSRRLEPSATSLWQPQSLQTQVCSLASVSFSCTSLNASILFVLANLILSLSIQLKTLTLEKHNYCLHTDTWPSKQTDSLTPVIHKTKCRNGPQEYTKT